MSMVITTDIFCDFKDGAGNCCPNVFEGGTGTAIRKVRERAKSEGWVQLYTLTEKLNPYVHKGNFVLKLVDYCPACFQKYTERIGVCKDDMV